MKKGNNIGCVVAIVVFVTLVLAMIVSRPNEQAHRNEVSQVVSAALTETEDSLMGDPADAGSLVLHHLGSALAKAMTREVVEHLVTVDDYGLFTVGHIEFGEERTLISVGVLGHVFTADKETIKTAANDYIQKKLDGIVKGVQETTNNFIDSLLQ